MSLARRRIHDHDRTTFLVQSMRYELVPMSGVEAAVTDLAPGTPVSVTCSPTRGIEATQHLTEQLLSRGHQTVPHVSARLVRGPDHVRTLARWFRGTGVTQLFVVGGDVTTPAGPYRDGLSLLRALLDPDTALTGVGVPAYPDGHGLIGPGRLHEALLEKQALLADADLDGWVTTQMCFDTTRIASWMADQRRRDMHLPAQIGVAGVVDRAHLLKMGLRLGVGTSLRYVRKNRSMTGRLLRSGRYDPTPFVSGIAGIAGDFDITGLHSFTFNRVAATHHWQQSVTR